MLPNLAPWLKRLAPYLLDLLVNKVIEAIKKHKSKKEKKDA